MLSFSKQQEQFCEPQDLCMFDLSSFGHWHLLRGFASVTAPDWLRIRCKKVTASLRKKPDKVTCKDDYIKLKRKRCICVAQRFSATSDGMPQTVRICSLNIELFGGQIALLAILSCCKSP